MNQAQINRIAGTLVALNKVLANLERLLDQEGDDQVMYYWKNTLTPSEKAEARLWIKGTLLSVGRLSQALQIQREVDDPFRMIRGELSALWVRIEDSKSKALKNYGELDAEMARILDPALTELSRRVNQISEAFGGKLR